MRRKRNRKITRHSRCAINSVNTVALIGLSFFALMVYWWQDALCTKLSDEIGKAERRLNSLERDYQREVASWGELKTPDNLRVALVRHALDMGTANQEQIVHMNADGTPAPGQMSVARIRARRGVVERVAEMRPNARPRAAAPARTLKKAAVRR